MDIFLNLVSSQEAPKNQHAQRKCRRPRVLKRMFDSQKQHHAVKLWEKHFKVKTAALRVQEKEVKFLLSQKHRIRSIDQKWHPF